MKCQELVYPETLTIPRLKRRYQPVRKEDYHVYQDNPADYRTGPAHGNAGLLFPIVVSVLEAHGLTNLAKRAAYLRGSITAWFLWWDHHAQRDEYIQTEAVIDLLMLIRCSSANAAIEARILHEGARKA